MLAAGAATVLHASFRASGEAGMFINFWYPVVMAKDLGDAPGVGDPDALVAEFALGVGAVVLRAASACLAQLGRGGDDDDLVAEPHAAAGRSPRRTRASSDVIGSR